MFDRILQLVKEHLTDHPEITSAIPADKREAVQSEIATHVANGVENHSAEAEEGLLGKLQGSIASGGTMASAIEGGLVNSLARKFGLPPFITSAIAGVLPGILAKVAQNAPRFSM